LTFHDELDVVPGPGKPLELLTSGLPVPGEPADNLCLSAYQLLKSEFNIPSLKIHLKKNIPMGAGLGGGSSDAAFTIKALNEEFSLGLDSARMMQYASQLGSDCAFFIENKPVFASGRGDTFEPVEVSLAGYTLLVVIPPVHVSTAEAYRKVTVKKPAEDIRELIRLDPGQWKDRLVNDFEDSIFMLHPVIQLVKEKLYANGAVYAAMSGSGSAVYGLFSRPVPEIQGLTRFFTWKGKLL
jgi:4-diphosphocytidyl-2-C-methyl-D-erythritol kinase